MAIQITYHLDTDPGQPDNVSLSNVSWETPDNFGMGTVAGPGVSVNGLSNDQLVVAVQSVLAALQTTVRATHANAVVTLGAVSIVEQTQQVTPLYPAA